MQDKEKGFWIRPSDVVKVVRCKDCNYGVYAGFGKVMCDLHPIVEKAHFYCASGERKGNGKE